MTKLLPAGIALAILASGAASAQTKFELADVHVSKPGTREGDGGFMPGGRIELRGRTMLDLISDAYGVDDANVIGTDRRYYVCKNTTMEQFAERLPNVAGAYVHPPLLDLTGLKGGYDFQLYWTPKGALSNAAAKAGADTAATPVDELTLFEAVDKLLGLKLEEQKHPVPVLVIDKVDRTPTGK